MSKIEDLNFAFLNNYQFPTDDIADQAIKIKVDAAAVFLYDFSNSGTSGSAKLYLYWPLI